MPKFATETKPISKGMRLSDLQTGQTGIISKVLGHGSFRKRVMEMGFVRGRTVTALLTAPLQDPIKYSLMGYEVSLRRSEANLIEIVLQPVDKESAGSVQQNLNHPVHTALLSENETAQDKSHGHSNAIENHANIINVALVGNPNCGKTSLFNIACKASEHVGNYSGVTVDAKTGHLRYGSFLFNIIDLPGTYSLSSYSPEEKYVRNYLRNEAVDVIVNVVDATNLERNLYLTTELIDMDRSMVIALNMYDEVKRDGTKLDYSLLGDMIGVPIVPTISRTGEGIDNLFDTVISVFEGNNTSVRHIHINLGNELENAIQQLRNRLKDAFVDSHQISTRFIAIKLLENDQEFNTVVEALPTGKDILELRDRLVEELHKRTTDDINETIASEKYGFIAGALAETLSVGESSRHTRTTIIDSVVTSRVFGYPLFLIAMFVTFWLTFAVGKYPMDWLQSGIDWLSSFVSDTLPDGILKDMIADGIIGGVGGVIVFLPNILILYFCLSLMEDTGYMARAAFIMDKLMHRIGLHGKSFIPLIMGFGCNVPAIMATRTIESRSSRIITILINPFMSCSARVPLYVLLVGTFFEAHAALVFFAIYIAGILVAILSAKLLRRFLFRKDETPFVMELPPYRVPTWPNLLRHSWTKGVQYLRKMSGLILVASIIVWALNYFPRPVSTPETQPLQQQTVQTDSYLKMAGKAINPVMEPLGFSWQATVAALAGVPAKEIVVSTLGVLYTGNEAVNDTSLGVRLQEINPVTDRPDFTAATALSFMIFILLYCPCLATVIAIVRETRHIKYGVFAVVYNTILAWLVAFGTYHVALLFQ